MPAINEARRNVMDTIRNLPTRDRVTIAVALFALAEVGFWAGYLLKG